MIIDAYIIKMFALILAEQAKIDAMKVDNAAHPDNPRYLSSDFFACAQNLETIAYKLNNND